MKTKASQAVTDAKAAKAAARRSDLAAGIRRRPVTFPNRKAKARKAACRGRVTY